MTFGRWLLIHSFSIFLVGLIVFGYIYREELRLEQAYAQLFDMVKTATVIETEQQTENQLQSAPKIAVVESEPEPEAGLSEAPAVKQEQVVEIVAEPTIAKPVDNRNDLLFDARQAYWDKDYSTSIHYYRRLIDRERSNPDYYGELGNIFYAMNDHRQASELYYQAAILLMEHGRADQARRLLSPVTAMNRQLGDKLKQRVIQ